MNWSIASRWSSFMATNWSEMTNWSILQHSACTRDCCKSRALHYYSRWDYSRWVCDDVFCVFTSCFQSHLKIYINSTLEIVSIDARHSFDVDGASVSRLDDVVMVDWISGSWINFHSYHWDKLCFCQCPKRESMLTTWPRIVDIRSALAHSEGVWFSDIFTSTVNVDGEWMSLANHFREKWWASETFCKPRGKMCAYLSMAWTCFGRKMKAMEFNNNNNDNNFAILSLRPIGFWKHGINQRQGQVF